MAEIIHFADAGQLVMRRKRVIERAANLVADIIIFTGVRYERLEAETCSGTQVMALPLSGETCLSK